MYCSDHPEWNQELKLGLQVCSIHLPICTVGWVRVANAIICTFFVSFVILSFVHSFICSPVVVLFVSSFFCSWFLPCKVVVIDKNAFLSKYASVLIIICLVRCSCFFEQICQCSRHYLLGQMLIFNSFLSFPLLQIGVWFFPYHVFQFPSMCERVKFTIKDW